MAGRAPGPGRQDPRLTEPRRVRIRPQDDVDAPPDAILTPASSMPSPLGSTVRAPRHRASRGLDPVDRSVTGRAAGIPRPVRRRAEGGRSWRRRPACRSSAIRRSTSSPHTAGSRRRTGRHWLSAAGRDKLEEARRGAARRGEGLRGQPFPAGAPRAGRGDRHRSGAEPAEAAVLPEDQVDVTELVPQIFVLRRGAVNSARPDRSRPQPGARPDAMHPDRASRSAGRRLWTPVSAVTTSRSSPRARRGRRFSRGALQLPDDGGAHRDDNHRRLV